MPKTYPRPIKSKSLEVRAKHQFFLNLSIRFQCEQKENDDFKTTASNQMKSTVQVVSSIATITDGWK